MTPTVCLTIDWYLPGTNSGGPVRSVANLVSALQTIDFYIITRNTDYCSDVPYTGIVPNQWLKQAPNVWVYYLSEDRVNKREIRRVLLQLQPDVLYVSGIYSRWFSQWPVFVGKKAGIKTVVAARGMLSPHALAVKPFKKWVFLRAMRWLNLYREVLFHATSPQEAADIHRVLGSHCPVAVVPNVGRSETAGVQPLAKTVGELRLVSVGRIAPEKGTLLGLQALGAVKGQVVLDLYGTAYDSGYWQQCEAVIAQLPSRIQVRYHGACDSEAVAEKLASAHALLLPSEGENYGHAIVESLSQGRPVIISQNTPWQGLAQRRAGWDVPVEALPNAIQTLLDWDQAEFNVWVDGAKNYHQTVIEKERQPVLAQYRTLFCGDIVAPTHFDGSEIEHS